MLPAASPISFCKSRCTVPENGALRRDCKEMDGTKRTQQRSTDDMKIAVAGTGYVGLSLAVLLSQHHQVTAVDVAAE